MKSNFLVAICPVCKVPWPTFSRDDLRIMDHDKLTSNDSLGEFIECSGSLLLVDSDKCYENED